MKTKTKDGLIGMAVIVGAIVIFSALPESQPTPEEIAAEKATVEECKKDLNCWADKNYSEASARCLSIINARVGDAAEWDDGSDLKLKYHRWLNRDKKTLTYYGESLLLRNAFGILNRQRFECDYDPEKERLIGFRLKPVLS